MKKFIRHWKKFDLDEIGKSLIVVGELSSKCFACGDIGLDNDAVSCPHCGVAFKYMGFSRKLKPSYLEKRQEQNPGIVLIDFEDFKENFHNQLSCRYRSVCPGQG